MASIMKTSVLSGVGSGGRPLFGRGTCLLWCRSARPRPRPGPEVSRFGVDIAAETESASEVRAQEAIGIDPVADSTPLVEPWVHAREVLGRYPRVLGQVDPSTHAHDQLIEFIAKGVETVVADWQVEGQGPSGHREREGSRVPGTEALQDGKERCQLQ